MVTTLRDRARAARVLHPHHLSASLLLLPQTLTRNASHHARQHLVHLLPPQLDGSWQHRRHQLWSNRRGKTSQGRTRHQPRHPQLRHHTLLPLHVDILRKTPLPRQLSPIHLMKQHHILAVTAILLLSACSNNTLRNSNPVIIDRNKPTVQSSNTAPTVPTAQTAPTTAPSPAASAAPTSPSGTRSIYAPTPTPTSSRQLNNYVEENIPVMPSRGRGYRPS